EIEEWIKEGCSPPIYIGNLSNINFNNVLKYSVRTSSTDHKIIEYFSNDAEIIIWDDGYEILARHVSKWSAIKETIRAYGIRKEEIAAFGDGPNDIQMLENAGIGIAMGNAKPNIKSSANFVTLNHNDNGLAEFIEQHLIYSDMLHMQ
ncbi:HAD family hydrolase, partial [Pseudomonas sp. 2822-15]|uniref:HAD family hydrolase n=1 Tax=Pseudomonas sp. 2822-15 TaxID=1712677 RepID=UPI0013047178